MPSIQDVAHHANVGIATVSRVLSGKGYVSEETRKRVMESIEALNYVPNGLARNLLNSHTHTVAVIVPDISNPFFSTFVNEVECCLRKQGYKSLLCNSVGEQNNEKVYLGLLERSLVDGVITASHLLDNRYYARLNLPIVSLDYALSDEIPMVCTDHTMGGRRAAELLVKAGCRHALQFRDSISIVLKARAEAGEESAAPEDFPYTRRHIEFERVIREAGIEYDEYIIQWDTFGVSAFAEIVQDAFRRFPGVDGVMATDILALQYMKLALQQGKRVPQELKIVAYDGTYLTDLCYPKVSTITQQIPEMAQKSVDLLLKRIAGEPIGNKRVVLPVKVTDWT